MMSPKMTNEKHPCTKMLLLVDLANLSEQTEKTTTVGLGAQTIVARHLKAERQAKTKQPTKHNQVKY